MATTLTFFGYTPPARFDLVYWVRARVEESATAGGAYTELETIPFFPPDLDPRAPTTRGFTTELATVGNWYRLVWIGGDDSESDPTEPVQFVDTSALTALGTNAELAAILKVDATANADTLDRVLLAATGEVMSEIGSRVSLDGWQLALATEVVLERAAEHWTQLKSPVGFAGLGIEAKGVPVVASHAAWERHADKLAPLRGEWGIA